MKKILIVINMLVLTLLLSCTDENSVVDLSGVSAPTNISALTTITQDNSGKVTFLPKGEGVTRFEVYFGDETKEPVFINPGATFTHTYKEGVFKAKIVGMGINGLKTEVIQDVMVSFLAPTMLEATVLPVVGDNFSVKVSAKAELETFFQVYFGESPTEIPVDFMQGEEITHTYAAVGTYSVRVVALSGGVATSEVTKTVIISNPISLPIDFETAVPPFGNFGGANSSVVANPNVSSVNGSTKVAKLVKNDGSEVWAGSAIELAAPIDFTSKKIMKMKVWSPKAGIIVKMKLEKLVATPATDIEVDAISTVANGWEELTFSFNGINSANNYQRVVVFFDFGKKGTGASYYYDDIQLVTGAEVLGLPLTFQSPTLVYEFGNFGGGNSIVIDNPDKSGINTSTKVGELTKGNNSEVWAGSAILMANPLNFATQTKLKMKVWSPKAGIIVKLKLENKVANDATNKEVDARTTIANGWEELTFDFAGIVNANKYQRIVVFFDFNVKGTGAKYYFDDITQSN
jgi:5S rRNA maturation endonuclease (ribonuclease M5)